MKLGISLYSYAGDYHRRKMTIYDAIEHAAKIGAQGVEIVADQQMPGWPKPSIAEINDLRKYINSFGLELTCLSTYLICMLRTDRKQNHQELVSEAKNHIMLAKLMGAKIVRPLYYDSKEELVEIINDCLPVLEEYDMTWGIEVHSPFPPSYYTEVVRKIHSPRVKLIPDFSCWQTMGLPTKFSSDDVASFIEMIPDICYVHGKGHVFNEQGEEPNTPYRALIGALKDANYEGFIVSEYEGWLMNYADSKEIVNTHFNLLKRYGS